MPLSHMVQNVSHQKQKQNVSHHSVLFFRFVTLSLSLIIDRIFFGQVSKNNLFFKSYFNIVIYYTKNSALLFNP